jgi:NADH-quinone oxidoreductase subunit A
MRGDGLAAGGLESAGMLLEYLPILILVVLAAAFAVGSIVASAVLGPRRPDPEKLSPYECGMEPVGTARERFSVKFYLVAMLFIIFDMEIVFLYPWAVVFQQLRLFGLVAMGTFLLVLLVGYFYVWKKGGLEWD